FTATASTELYTLSLHDALPISSRVLHVRVPGAARAPLAALAADLPRPGEGRAEESPARAQRRVLRLSSLRRGRRPPLRRLEHLRSEEHTSELQSLAYLVCRLLL